MFLNVVNICNSQKDCKNAAMLNAKLTRLDIPDFITVLRCSDVLRCFVVHMCPPAIWLQSNEKKTEPTEINRAHIWYSPCSLNLLSSSIVLLIHHLNWCIIPNWSQEYRRWSQGVGDSTSLLHWYGIMDTRIVANFWLPLDTNNTNSWNVLNKCWYVCVLVHELQSLGKGIGFIAKMREYKSLIPSMLTWLALLIDC